MIFELTLETKTKKRIETEQLTRTNLGEMCQSKVILRVRILLVQQFREWPRSMFLTFKSFVIRINCRRNYA